MIVGVHHIAVGVDDIDRALTFYTEGLGFEILKQGTFGESEYVDRAIGLKDAKGKSAMLRGPNLYLEVWQFVNPRPDDLRSRPCDCGYPHFALQVDNIQEEYERLQTHGMEFVGEVVHLKDGSFAIYGRDPCGNIIELYDIRSPGIAQLAR